MGLAINIPRNYMCKKRERENAADYHSTVQAIRKTKQSAEICTGRFAGGRKHDKRAAHSPQTAHVPLSKTSKLPPPIHTLDTPLVLIRTIPRGPLVTSFGSARSFGLSLFQQHINISRRQNTDTHHSLEAPATVSRCNGRSG